MRKAFAGYLPLIAEDEDVHTAWKFAVATDCTSALLGAWGGVSRHLIVSSQDIAHERSIIEASIADSNTVKKRGWSTLTEDRSILTGTEELDTDMSKEVKVTENRKI